MAEPCFEPGAAGWEARMLPLCKSYSCFTPRFKCIYFSTQISCFRPLWATCCKSTLIRRYKNLHLVGFEPLSLLVMSLCVSITLYLLTRQQRRRIRKWSERMNQRSKQMYRYLCKNDVNIGICATWGNMSKYNEKCPTMEHLQCGTFHH